MQSDIDAQLTNFFEEAPPREFVTVMRGYDRPQVDEHIRQIEAEVRQHREQAQAMQRELSEAHRQIQEQERPTYSGLGGRIEQLLRLAEEQATEVVQARPGRADAAQRLSERRCRVGVFDDRAGTVCFAVRGCDRAFRR